MLVDWVREIWKGRRSWTDQSVATMCMLRCEVKWNNGYELLGHRNCTVTELMCLRCVHLGMMRINEGECIQTMRVMILDTR